MNRGANHKRIFFKDNDYDLFINVLKEASNLFNVYISAYLDDEAVKVFSKEESKLDIW